MNAEAFVFWVFAIVTVGSAAVVVLSRQLIYSAFALLFTFVGVAGLYLMLGADFLAATQLLIYVGGILVLLLFGVMLTRAKLGSDSDLDNAKAWAYALPIALLLLGVLVYVLVAGFEDDKIGASGSEAVAGRTSAISDLIFSAYAVPFWGLSFVLLAAAIGSIVLARKD